MNKSLIASVIACVGVAFACCASYTELESITATGSSKGKQYVNAGYVPQPTDRLEMKFRLNSTKVNMALWCSRYGNNARSFTCFVMGASSPNCFRFDHGGSQASGNTPLTSENDLTVIANGKTGECFVDGVLQNNKMATASYEPSGALSLFASHTDGDNFSGLNNFADLTFYYLKIYNADGELIRHYVPAEDNAAAAISKARYGVYEKKTQVFCPNLSTAAPFTPGAVKGFGGLAVVGLSDEATLLPAAGEYEFEDGDEQTFTAIPGTNTTAWIRSRLLGYTLETFDASTSEWSEPVFHEGDTYVHKQVGNTGMRLTWLWAREARLLATAGGEGTVSAGGVTGASIEVWSALGQPLDVLADTQAPGRTFASWTGDVEEGDVWDEPLPVLMDRGKSVTATFGAAGDGAALVEAVKSAAAGSTVTVAPGIYRLPSALSPTAENVTLRGDDADPSRVILHGNCNHRCLTLTKPGAYVSGLTFRDGTVTSTGGGGVYAVGATVTNCVFEHNVALHVNGGGIYAKSGTAVLDCTFVANVVTNTTVASGPYGGGGIAAEDGSVTIRGCRFVNNAAWNGNCNGGGGAGIRFGGGALGSVRDCSFTRNRGSYGVISGVLASLEGCMFATNTASFQLYLTREIMSPAVAALTTLVENCTFVYNAAPVCKGREQHCCLRYRNCTFKDGYTKAGNDYFYELDTNPKGGSLLSMTNCTVSSYTNMLAGGLTSTEPCHDMYGCTVEDCFGYRQDYGLVLSAGCAVRNCRFLRNRWGQYDNGGGMIQVTGTDAVIESCLFVSNRTQQAAGGVISLYNSSKTTSARIDNCTFAYNHTGGTASDSYGGTLRLTADSPVRNCLFFRNWSAKANRYVFYDKDSEAAFKANFVNCWETDAVGQLAGNETCFVDTTGEHDLKFVDPDPYTSRNFEIAKDSPLVDKGVDLDWIGPRTLDVRNDRHYKRLYGEHPDIGAYEFGRLPGLLLFVR